MGNAGTEGLSLGLSFKGWSFGRLQLRDATEMLGCLEIPTLFHHNVLRILRHAFVFLGTCGLEHGYAFTLNDVRQFHMF
jgi:hypothetical protein